MKKFILLISAVTLWQNVGAQAPSFGSLSRSNLNYGTGSNALIITINSASPVTSFSASSSNNALFSVTGTTFTGNTGVVYGVVPTTGTGSITLNLSADNSSGTGNTTRTVNIGEFYERGPLFSVYDIVFWQRSFPGPSTPAVLSTVLSSFRAIETNAFYCPLGLTVGPALNPGNCLGCNEGNFSCFQRSDGMTIGFTGYLTPTLTGTYTFTASNQDDFDVFLADRKMVGSTPSYFYTRDDSTSNMLLTANRILFKGPGTNSGLSFTTTLIGGLKYAIRAAAWPVFSKNLVVQWSGPGFGTRNITPADILPYRDLIAPSAPTGLALVNKGTTFIRFKWNASTDDQKLVAYNIYVNGVKNTSVPGTSFVLTGLGLNSTQYIAITAVDLVGNESAPSNILSATTYGADNTPPSAPNVFINNLIGDLSASISWRKANDVGSEVVAYNITLLGASNQVIASFAEVIDTTMLFKVLAPNTTYKLRIQSIDGASNLSPASTDYLFNTTAFNPLLTAAGIRKASVSFSPKAVGRNEGFGINHPYTSTNYNYYGPGGNIAGSNINSLIGLNPSLLRFGALEANNRSFDAYSGTSPQVSIGDLMATSIKINGGYVSYAIGIANTTDWVIDPRNTALTFMEYLCGPINTPGGARRNLEGYSRPFILDMKGVFIEMGNEAWGASCNSPRPACPGGINHNCDVCYSPQSPLVFNYEYYGKWCRSVAGFIKESPYYETYKDKIKLFYSGRNASPNESYGQNIAVVRGDKGDLDGLAISGYMGGNFNYTPGIDRGTSELEYYQNSTGVMYNNIKGLQATMNDTWNESKTYKIFYMYESNMTRTEYNGKLGQAVIMNDYFLESLAYGCALPSSFALLGGEWTMIDPVTSRPLPMYSINSIMSYYTKGNVLDKKIHSLVTLRTGSGVPLTGFDPVGAHLFHENGKYALVLISRDFTIDYQVQINELSQFLTPASQASLFAMHSTNQSFNDLIVTTSVTSANTTLQNGMIVNVPKFGFVVMTFNGVDLNQPKLPLGYTRYRKPEKITLKPLSGFTKDIDAPSGFTQYEAEVDLAGGPFSTEVVWSWSADSQDFLDAITVNIFTVTGKVVLNVQGASCQPLANGVLKIKATSAIDPYIFAEDSVILSNQELNDEGDVCVDNIHKKISSSITLYPNPAESILNIHANKQTVLETTITDMYGTLVISKYFDGTSSDVVVNTATLPAGVYVIEITTSVGKTKKKFMKQ